MHGKQSAGISQWHIACGYAWADRKMGTICFTWTAPSTWDVCTVPDELKVQEIFSTTSTKISSRRPPPVRLVSRMDLMTPVGPLPTPGNSVAARVRCIKHCHNCQGCP